ncbi:MAG: NAD-glutamate dehydrogenase [Proteobacteria bacterium]|nr:NAD-glutamate dehydrogenase [Pseudomonadota bacterium]
MSHLQKLERQKSELLAKIVARIRDGIEGEAAAEMEAFARQYFANVPPLDMVHQRAEDLYGQALAMWRFSQTRPPGRVRLRVYNPNPQEHGWSATHTVVEIVNDDMPFLVDSVSAALNRLDLLVQLVIHPIVWVQRNPRGERIRLAAPAEREGAAGVVRESLIHVEINQQSDPAVFDAIGRELEAVLADVRVAVADWQPMRARLGEVMAEIGARHGRAEAEEVKEVQALLRWIGDDHYTFLGFRDHLFEGPDETARVRVDGNTALGLLRDPGRVIVDALRDGEAMPAEVREFLRQPDVLMINKANKRSTVHRSVHLDMIAVKRFDEEGRVTGIHTFVGLFTSVAYSLSPRQIPLLRRKLQKVVTRAGFPPASHDGKALVNILEGYPRDELFQIGEDELFTTALGILHLQDRQRLALFVRRDAFERFVSCLVFLPRDRYNTDLRETAGRILAESFNGRISTFYTQITDSPLARVHYIVRTRPGRIPDYDVDAIEARLTESARSWSDRLQEALVAEKGEEQGVRLLRAYGTAFPSNYTDRYTPREAVFDIDVLETVHRSGRIGMNLYRPAGAGEDRLRFKIYNPGNAVPLSDALPVLENMGVRVVDEIFYEVRRAVDGKFAVIHDFGLLTRDGASVDAGEVRPKFHDAFEKIWTGAAENDPFNRLVVSAGLAARGVMVLRAFYKYLRQTGIAFSQDYVADTLGANPRLARLLVELFVARFDPDRRDQAEARSKQLLEEFTQGLDAVANPDQDRILRRLLNLVEASLRTNYFQAGADGGPKPYFSFKLASARVDELPVPRPMAEIFVYSPRMEGIHLRGGKVARGGIRWSDRREDFRTEVLGLMKAQMVKNAVIVPVGAKGGFIVKNPPAEGGRDALFAEGIACYKTLVRGMLDLTDNYKGAEVVHPPRVVRYDDDDPYIVAAADKGTATFSDIANELAAEYGFWLGDAFASGGSHGYDHKKVGITARGAWEAVKRHFRELGKAIQGEDFTVVGIGDMSGDVFGNGMLQSRHIKLIGAFNHLHILVDPDPDPAASFAERARLFALPRSSWSDYDKAKLSPGGAVYERAAKSVRLSPQAKARLVLAKDVVAPSELIAAILAADVDLLWSAGIGTFVKASDESHADVGDRTNDPVRRNARDLRCKVIGEGGNLGVTQRGRIEFALRGGRVNTDSLDNSGGVDCSDHEVNIKILLDTSVAQGAITVGERNDLLVAMTDEVAAHVIRTNYLQSQAVSLVAAQGAQLLDHQARLMRTLERAGTLDRQLEALPDEETLAERAVAGIGLTRPEIAVLMAHSKIWLYDQLLKSDLPDEPHFAEDLLRYFPTPLRRDHEAAIRLHRLRRELIATTVTNSMINRVDGTFVTRLMEGTGMSPPDIARAYTVARDAFDMRGAWEAIESLDAKVAASTQMEMTLEGARLIEAATLWFLRNRPQPLDIAATCAEFAPGIEALAGALAGLVPADTRRALERAARALVKKGVPEALAHRVARFGVLESACDIVHIARSTGRDVAAVGRVYFGLGHRFGLDWLRASAARLEQKTHWEKLAVAAVIEDLFTHQRALAQAVLARAGDGAGPEAAIEAWGRETRATGERVHQLLSEIRASAGAVDLAMLAVANRHLRALAAD